MKSFSNHSRNYTQQPAKKSKKIRHISLLLLLLTVIVWSYAKITNPNTFPIQSVRIIGNDSFVNPQAIQTTIAPYLKSGLLNIKLNPLQTQLEKIPWVESVRFWRVWPHELVIDITQQTPIAHWNETALLNDNGDTFSPNDKTLSDKLPWFYGPSNQMPTVLTAFHALNALLRPIQLRINVISLTTRGAWRIRLNNGMLLILGSEDVPQRLERFIKVYPELFAHQTNSVEYIDLRYPNGLAVQWKNSIGVNTRNGEES